MKEVIFIKYGGSIITDKKNAMSVSSSVIDMLNEQIRIISSESSYSIIIGNGGGAFGHYFAEKHQLYNGNINSDTFLGICKGKNGNSFLNRMVVENLLDKHILSCSVKISVPYILGKIQNSWEEVFVYLNNGIIPVLYGDILFFPNKKYSIISTEQAFLDLSEYFLKYKSEQYRVSKFILCTNTNGVLDKNGINIPSIPIHFNDFSLFWKNPDEYDVTGGMSEKVKKSLKLAKVAPVYIINGMKENAILKVMNGETAGTTIIS